MLRLPNILHCRSTFLPPIPQAFRAACVGKDIYKNYVRIMIFFEDHRGTVAYNMRPHHDLERSRFWTGSQPARHRCSHKRAFNLKSNVRSSRRHPHLACPSQRFISSFIRVASISNGDQGLCTRRTSKFRSGLGRLPARA